MFDGVHPLALQRSLIRELDVDRVLVPDRVVTEPRWARPWMLSGTAEADTVGHGPACGT